MPFWTVRRVFKTAVFGFVVLLIGWAAVVLAGAVVSEANVGRDYLARLGLPSEALIPLPASDDTYASLTQVQHWFEGRGSRRVLLVSDAFHMLRLRIIAGRLGLVPFTSPAPGSPIRASLRRNTAYHLAEGFKVPLTWLFQH